MTTRKTVGEVLIDLLEHYAVDTVFGIPGVHTVELYRGLANSPIRHVTPRHELSAGFMADGYARATGKPGVCFLITGPGLTNAITAMAQARADSVPMLIISGVNHTATLGHEEGHLHELPDQSAMIRTIASFTHRLQNGSDLARVVARAFVALNSNRPGPVHIEIPIDIMSEVIDMPNLRPLMVSPRAVHQNDVENAADLLKLSKRPLLLAGGGAKNADQELSELAEKLNAPVISTVNGRGLMAGHPLLIPASPSLPAVRKLIAQADVVVAVGTEFGSTDYDMYLDGKLPTPQKLIRIDVDPAQTTRTLLPDLAIVADAKLALGEISNAVIDFQNEQDGAQIAEATRRAVTEAMSADYKRNIELIRLISNVFANGIIVGDSTQPVYAGNMYCDIDRPNGWFNSATGYGSLGYGPPAAVGASIGKPELPIICLTGDGGFQFCLSELGTAMDEQAFVTFIVWNNFGYQEIENYMMDNNISPVGVRPTPPEYVKIADAYGMSAQKILDLNELPKALERANANKVPNLIEIVMS